MNTNMQIAGVNGVTKKVIDPITKENVLSVTFLRENGLFTVRCRSKQFHKYFKNQAPDADYGDADGKWDRSIRRSNNVVMSFKYHRPENHDEYQSIRNWGKIANILLFQDNDGVLTVPNISWIRATTLDIGIKVIICNTPTDADRFNLYCDATMKYLSKMYNKYMTKKQSKGKITTKLENLS
jgi:hypothetical protein